MGLDPEATRLSMPRCPICASMDVVDGYTAPDAAEFAALSILCASAIIHGGMATLAARMCERHSDLATSSSGLALEMYNKTEAN